VSRGGAIAIGAAAVLALSAAGAVAWYRIERGRQAEQPHPHVEYFCPMHPQIVRDKPGECPICGMKLERRETDGASPSPSASAARRILYYRHPMNPAVHSDKPAKDDMGMDYVPVYEGENQPQGAVAGRVAVTVAPERVQLLGIRSEPVTSGFAGGEFRTVGRVAIEETRREVVHAKYEGYVEKLYVDFTGKPVRRGQPLLAIYSPELVAAQQEYLVARQARARLGGSTVPGVARGGADLADAARQRLRYWDMSDTEIEELERTGKPRRTVILRAPVSGVVLEKAAVEGMKVSPADRLYEIADLSRVWVLAELYEKDMGAVRVGTAARITRLQETGGGWRGRASFVSPTVKPETRTFEVRIEVDNSSRLLKPDMLVDVHFETGRAPALVVPESAVIQTGERTLVFLDRGEGRFEPREVTLGSRVAGGYEVLRGLAAGDRVVVSTNFLLDSESSLRAAIAGMSR
jgi:membrane fusion protein, copper/silver efflux system